MGNTCATNNNMSNTEAKLSLQEFVEILEKLCNPSTSDSPDSGDKDVSLPFKPGTDWQDILDKPVYGRICTNTTTKLAAAPGRKTAFVFGPETLVSEVFLTKSPYEILLHLGFLPEYIHLKVSFMFLLCKASFMPDCNAAALLIYHLSTPA